MKKIIFVFLVLLLAGCARQRTSYETDFHKGTSGIELSFLQNMPPTEVFNGSTFQLGIELKNNGAFDVTNGILFISSYDRDYSELSSNIEEIDLLGKSQYTPAGERDIKTFTVKNKGTPTHEDFITMFVATACYLYDTYASPIVCVNPDIYQTTSPVCNPETVTLSGGQGAPVAVTKVEQGIIPKEEKVELTFKIYIKNVGKGYVRSESNYRKDCSPSLIDFLVEKEIDRIHVEAELSGKYLKCLSAIVDLSKEETYTVCNIELPKSQKAYTTPLKITLSYGYVDVVVKDMRIKKVSK